MSTSEGHNSQGIQRDLSDQIRAAQPRYNFRIDRWVMSSGLEMLLHNGASSTENEQQPSNDFWTAASFPAIQSWASASLDFGLIQGSVTSELFIGTPVSSGGQTMDAIYVVVRHWKGHSRSNTLSLAQYSTVRDLISSGREMQQAFQENFVNGIRGLKSFLISLLDFGTQQSELVGQPLPNGRTEAITVVVSGTGWAAEGGAANNTTLPTNMTIEYTDLVVSFDLLVFYESVYLWNLMLTNLHGNNGRITWQELSDFFREEPHGPNSHPVVQSWYDFCDLHGLTNRAGPLPDPRAEGYRFSLDHYKMDSLYHKVLRYYNR